VQKEIADGEIKLVGDKGLVQSIQQWLGLNPFAKENNRRPA
jgi:hypothetical protein